MTPQKGTGHEKRNLSLTRKRGLMGYAYLRPWISGFLLFFLTPVVKTAIYSFNTFDKVTLTPPLWAWPISATPSRGRTVPPRSW